MCRNLKHWGMGMFCRTRDKLKTPLQHGHPPSAALKDSGIYTAGRRGELHTGFSGEETRAWGHFQSTLKLRLKCTVTTLMSFRRCRNIWVWGESWRWSLTAWNWSCEMTPPWKPPGIIHLQLRPAPWGQFYPLLVMAQQSTVMEPPCNDPTGGLQKGE